MGVMLGLMVGILLDSVVKDIVGGDGFLSIDEICHDSRYQQSGYWLGGACAVLIVTVLEDSLN